MEVLRADGGSFKDPAGQVYRVMQDTGEAGIVRGLNPSAAGIMGKLLAEPFFHDLVDGGQVVATRLLHPELPNARHVMKEGWSAAVEHQAVDFVTWPYEWPFSMLKDAALLQLQVLETGARNGWLLKDATSFNVQWMGVRPVFIDIPSFVPWEEGEYWRGYRQFCATFLTPLLLTAHSGHPVPAAAPLAPRGYPARGSKSVLPWAGAFQARRPVACLVSRQGRTRSFPIRRPTSTTAEDDAVRAVGQPAAAHRRAVQRAGSFDLVAVRPESFL